ncbi:MAG TPA: thioredoxin domain-containing protein [Aggregatilineales bacterium]|nr:thioredoxin domain-containing protein [Aggregatilineales bacterium]
MNKFTFAVTGENIEERVLNSDLPVLVEFGASWCPPCKMIAPLVEAVARKFQGKLLVGVVDDDADPDIAPRYDVQGLPTLILFRKGQPVQRLVGFRPQQQLEAAVLPFLDSVPEGTA